MDPEKKSLNFIFPIKYVIPKSLNLAIGQVRGSRCIKWSLQKRLLKSDSELLKENPTVILSAKIKGSRIFVRFFLRERKNPVSDKRIFVWRANVG